VKRIIVTALAVAAVLLAAGCGTKHAGTAPATFGPAASSARAAASSALANPTVSADLSAAEQQLLANLQKNFSPAHPVKSVQAAVRATFPQGGTARIESYAVKTFTIAVLHTKGPGSARDTWLQGVVTYAEAQGAQAGYTPPASPGTGTVPGAASPSPATSGA
jgi:hypothetical protein